MKPSSTQSVPQSSPAAVTQTKGPQLAVQEYLNALLQDATAQANVEDSTIVVAKTAEQQVSAPAPVVTVQADPVEVAVTPVEEVVQASEPVEQGAIEQSIEQAPDTEVLSEPESAESQVWQDGRPPWAQQRFECLLFKVAGLTLAVPLVELGGVLVIEEEMRSVFGQPDWFLGLLPSKTAGTVKAIDTARWVMPERYPEDAEGFKYVILMEGSDWGMACHGVEDAITLEPEEVSWRSDRGRRPWLAGTVVDHMCAIMDVAALLDLLEQSQAGRPAPKA